MLLEYTSYTTSNSPHHYDSSFLGEKPSNQNKNTFYLGVMLLNRTFMNVVWGQRFSEVFRVRIVHLGLVRHC